MNELRQSVLHSGMAEQVPVDFVIPDEVEQASCKTVCVQASSDTEDAYHVVLPQLGLRRCSGQSGSFSSLRSGNSDQLTFLGRPSQSDLREADETESMQQLRDDMTRQIADLRQEMQSKIDCLEASINQKNKELEKKEKELQQKDDEILRWQKKAKWKDEELEQEKLRKQWKEEEVRKVTETMMEMAKHKDAMLSEKDNQIAELRAERDRLKSDVENLTCDVASLKQQLESLQNQKDAMQKDFDKMRSEMREMPQSRNQASQAETTILSFRTQQTNSKQYGNKK